MECGNGGNINIEIDETKQNKKKATTKENTQFVLSTWDEEHMNKREDYFHFSLNSLQNLTMILKKTVNQVSQKAFKMLCKKS